MEPEMNKITRKHKNTLKHCLDIMKKIIILIEEEREERQNTLTPQERLEEAKEEIREDVKEKKEIFLLKIKRYLERVIEEDLNYRLEDLTINDVAEDDRRGYREYLYFADNFWEDVKEDIKEKFL